MWGPLETSRLNAMVAKMAPGSGLSARINQWRFKHAAKKCAASLAPLISADATTSTGQAVDARPELLSFVRAPYFCAGWTADACLNHLSTHLAQLDQHPPLNFPVSHSINLIPLAMIGRDIHVVIDKPMWFHREGVLTINLFDGNYRLFSLVFSFEPTERLLRAMIGGIQGRHFDDALERYHHLTKASHGLRPRDLLIELFRLICAQVGVSEIRAIADAGRQNRHPYFGKDATRELSLSYDAIWKDRGGTPVDKWFWHLPLRGERRADADIPARKRSMYRQRYAMLDAIQGELATVWGVMVPVVRADAL